VRARRLWPRVFPGQSLECGFDFVVWSQTAPQAELMDAVRTFFSDGGTVVRGRARPGGKRSKSRLEPIILGRARGAGSPSQAKAEPPTGRDENRPPSPGIGRPRADAADALVMHLATDWALVTGLENDEVVPSRELEANFAMPIPPKPAPTIATVQQIRSAAAIRGRGPDSMPWWTTLLSVRLCTGCRPSPILLDKI
jgi:hypothetical protein